MKPILIAALLVTLAGAAGAKDRPELLWGTQQASRVTGVWQHDGNVVELERRARIAEVESDAPSYCLWARGKAVACGSDSMSPAGAVLEPGRYTVYPRLRKAQAKARVEVKLEYIE